jgi:pentatricopeptide repeat protein
MFDFFMLMQHHATPDNSTFAQMIIAIGEKGDIPSVVNLLHMMQNLGVEPDEITYTAVINAFGKVGDTSRVYQIFEEYTLLSGYFNLSLE